MEYYKFMQRYGNIIGKYNTEYFHLVKYLSQLSIIIMSNFFPDSLPLQVSLILAIFIFSVKFFNQNKPFINKKM